MSTPETGKSSPKLRVRRQYIPAVGPKLRKLLYVVLGLFAVLTFNSVYLGTITFSEWVTGVTYQDYFYQYNFLLHLTLGLLLIVPVIVYGIIHIKNAHDRPNRRAVTVGYALFTVAVLLLGSGLVLTRGLPLVEIRQPVAREVSYWMHVAAPLLVAWLFILHRLAGPRINWRFGGAVAGLTALFAVGMLVLQAQDPRQWNVVGPASGEKYFFPSLARTATGNFIPAKTLMMDNYCKECHADTHEKWANSMHRFASFNNPAYLFSVRNTRKFSMERDGNVQAARFCAGCHDLVPFFSGAFDDPNFDDVNHPTSQAGVTCTGCHAITNVNSRRGNSDYTIEEPLHYPFAFSENPFLQWVNRLLVKAKPDFHKKTFLKPLHKTAEFCAGCHKVHLAPEFNHYKWLRGQNHYDPYHLSGVSGHGIKSFYYPPKATHNCSEGCHMPLEASTDFGAKPFDGKGVLQVHDHQFPTANTAIPHMLDMPSWVNDAHRKFLEGTVRVDIVALREGGTIDGKLIAPIRPEIPALKPGGTYLVEVVIRTMKLGHIFTQGTADSNEVWLDIAATSGDQTIGRSGGMDRKTGEVDPWSHFINAYVIDRDGNRIDRRNPETIFTALYSNQIPPGAADSVHFVLKVPENAGPDVKLTARLQYRKFDTTYMKYFEGDKFTSNDLPITTIGSDQVVLPVAGLGTADTSQARDIPEWQRWNDYGIGLLRKGGPGQLRQAEEVFKRVEELGRPDGPMNLARLYIREGRLDEAVGALRRASEHNPPAYPWSVAYFTAVVNRQNGYLDEALEGYADVINTQFQEAREREFDFSQDYTLLNEYAQTLFDRSKLERNDPEKRNEYLRHAAKWFERVLEFDVENAQAHYGLSQAYARLGDLDKEREHRALYAKYKVDDNARDRAIVLARQKSRPANHAAEAIVLYDLERPGAYELADKPATDKVATR